MLINVNPKGKKTGDCVTRALATALNVSWDQALTEQFNLAIKTKLSVDDTRLINKLLTERGFTKMNMQPKKGCHRCTVGALAYEYLSETIVVRVAGHLTVIKEGEIFDTWDCSNCAVYCAWIKE